MSLSPDQIQQFKNRGFALAPEFFSYREIRAMQLEVSHWMDGKFARDVSTKPDQKQNLQLIPLHTRSSLFRSLPFDPKVIDAVESLIGKPILKILDQMFYKPSETGMGTHWHTDNSYFKLENPMHGTAMWIAIHDATIQNGALKVIPDVFAQEFPHERDPDSDHHIYTQLDESSAVHCELKAGGVVFFCFGTPHATGDNQSEHDRAGVGMHFVNHERVLGYQRERWQQVSLSKPDSTRGVREYGKELDFQEEVGILLHEHETATE